MGTHTHARRTKTLSAVAYKRRSGAKRRSRRARPSPRGRSKRTYRAAITIPGVEIKPLEIKLSLKQRELQIQFKNDPLVVEKIVWDNEEIQEFSLKGIGIPRTIITKVLDYKTVIRGLCFAQTIFIGNLPIGFTPLYEFFTTSTHAQDSIEKALEGPP